MPASLCEIYGPVKVQKDHQSMNYLVTDFPVTLLKLTDIRNPLASSKISQSISIDIYRCNDRSPGLALFNSAKRFRIKEYEMKPHVEEDTYAPNLEVC